MSLHATTRYRYGERDTSARVAHAIDTREWRHGAADAVLNDAIRDRLLNMLRRGTPLRDALDTLNITHQQVYGRSTWDPVWAADLEAALADGCPGRTIDRCGTETGYKAGGRCQRCRTAHRGTP